jgi:hypothetical protein
MGTRAQRRVLQPEDLERVTVEIGDLRPHPQNPNNGDQDLINQSIRTHGQFRGLLVSSDNVILAGNHTYHALMEAGRDRVVVDRIPLPHDDPQAIEIMLADNRAGDKRKYDDGILAALLGNLKEQQGELDGTLFDQKFLDRLLNEEDVKSGELNLDLEYKVVVDCRDEGHQRELLDRFEAEGLQVKALIA